MMSVKTGGVAVPDGFDPAPSVAGIAAVAIEVAPTAPSVVDAVGVLVGSEGEVPSEVGHDRAALEAAGFDGKPGQSLVLPQAGGSSLVVVGAGSLASTGADGLRNAAGSFARAAGPRARLALVVPPIEGVAVELAGQVATEGILLAGTPTTSSSPSRADRHSSG